MNSGVPESNSSLKASDQVAVAISKKKAKIRSAWISFAGRIAAQIIGAVATVALGVVVLGKPTTLSSHAAGKAAAEDTPVTGQPWPALPGRQWWRCCPWTTTRQAPITSSMG